MDSDLRWAIDLNARQNHNGYMTSHLLYKWILGIDIHLKPIFLNRSAFHNLYARLFQIYLSMDTLILFFRLRTEFYFNVVKFRYVGKITTV